MIAFRRKNKKPPLTNPSVFGIALMFLGGLTWMVFDGINAFAFAMCTLALVFALPFRQIVLFLNNNIVNKKLVKEGPDGKRLFSPAGRFVLYFFCLFFLVTILITLYFGISKTVNLLSN